MSAVKGVDCIYPRVVRMLISGDAEVGHIIHPIV